MAGMVDMCTVPGMLFMTGMLCCMCSVLRVFCVLHMSAVLDHIPPVGSAIHGPAEKRPVHTPLFLRVIVPVRLVMGSMFLELFTMRVSIRILIRLVRAPGAVF